MAASFNQQTVEIILPNMIGYERIAMACANSFARLAGLSTERTEDLKTIVSEATINAMQHGNEQRPDAKVTLLMNFKDNAITVWVIDEGAGIQRLLPDPNIDKMIEEREPPIGFGLFLIRQLADGVEYNAATDRGPALKMVIKVAS